MQSALERRTEMADILIARRYETIPNLAREFGVSTSTVKRDIYVLSQTFPLYTIPGKGGGVRIVAGYDKNRLYLTTRQEEVLRRVRDQISLDDSEVITEILSTFTRTGIS